MPPVKVIVQGFPSYFRYKEISGRRKEKEKKELEYLFSRYGQVKCVYLWPETPYESWRKWQGMVPDNFAQLIFKHADDALEARDAANNHEITFDNRILTLTPVIKLVTPIDILEDEILIKIFSMLDPPDKITIEKVCERWRKLAPDIWSNKTLYLGGRVAPHECCCDTELEDYLKKCGNNLKYLTYDVTSHKGLDLIRKYCNSLRNMTLWIYLKNPRPSAFLEMFRALANLTVIQIHFYPDLPGFDIFDHLPESMTEIHLVYTHRNSYYFDLKRFPKLRSLTLRGFYRGLHLTGMDHRENLIHLDFKNSTIDAHMLWKIRDMTRLKTLIIPEVKINDEILIQILRRNWKLECLDISAIPTLTDRAVREALWLPNLEVLKIRRLSVTLDIYDPMPSLKRLDCEGCQKLKDEQLGQFLELVPNLEYLNIKNTSITSSFLKIAEGALRRRRRNVPLRLSSDFWKTKKGSYSSLLLLVN
ncbi:uncharacterized protein LOC135161376 [Diachasmimorpha longicaudata]|uniref:uncharacterized protein LOC135161376 n=1 Tax=Diachasmimorpha longicaudata TaxID=58733 RepID=UPI0030B897CA